MIRISNMDFIKAYVYRYGVPESIAYKRLHEIFYKYGDNCEEMTEAVLEKGRILNPLQVISWRLMKRHMQKALELLQLPDPESIDRLFPKDSPLIYRRHVRFRVPAYREPARAWYGENGPVLSPVGIEEFEIVWHLRRKAKTSLFLVEGENYYKSFTEMFWTLEDDYGNSLVAEKPYDGVWGHRPMPETKQ